VAHLRHAEKHHVVNKADQVAEDDGADACCYSKSEGQRAQRGEADPARLALGLDGRRDVPCAVGDYTGHRTCSRVTTTSPLWLRRTRLTVPAWCGAPE